LCTNIVTPHETMDHYFIQRFGLFVSHHLEWNETVGTKNKNEIWRHSWWWLASKPNVE